MFLFRYRSTAALAVVLVSLTLASVRAQLPECVAPPYAPNQALVKPKPPATINIVIQNEDVDSVAVVGGAGWYLVHSRSEDTPTLVARLSARPDVLYAEPNWIVQGGALCMPGTPPPPPVTLTPPPPVTLTLTSSANPSTVGQEVTFTATLSGGSETLTGTVQFFDGPVLLGSATVLGGQASLITSKLNLGS